MRALTIEARAKINLFLKVGPRRADGFHDLETIFHSITLSDLLKLELLADSGTDGYGAEAGRDPRVFNFDFLCDDDSITQNNLVTKAAVRLVAEWEESKQSPEYLQELRIVLEKQLPVGAGLAGGSADAAAALAAVNKIYDIGFDRARLMPLAEELGSDVPFCLEGGCSLGRGRGEILSPLPLLPKCAVAIAVPPFAIATADAYRWLDEDRASSSHPRSPSTNAEGPALELLVKALEEQDLGTVGLLLHNDFETPVFKRHPELRQLKDAALGLGAAGALLSGSGSALFALCESSAVAERVARGWESTVSGSKAYLCGPAVTGLYERH